MDCRGQGSSEYLILLATVIGIALLGAAIVAYYVGTAPDLRESESKAYWAGYARPFAVLESSYQRSGACGPGSTAGVYMVVQNTESRKLNITSVLLNGEAATFCVAGQTSGASLLQFNPGQKTTVAAKVNATLCANMTRDSAMLGFRFDSQYINNSLQNGTMKLVFGCN